MSTFERYLTLWVGLCIAVGVALGHLLPAVSQAIGSAEVAQVNLPVAVLIWLMIIPMLAKIDFAALGQVREHWRGIGVTLFAAEGTTRTTLHSAALVVARFFFTPFKAFPLLREGFEIPALRCEGRGLTVTAEGGNPPRVIDQRLGDIGGLVPIPWPEGTIGNPGPDYVPPAERKKRERAAKQKEKSS